MRALQETSYSKASLNYSQPQHCPQSHVPCYPARSTDRQTCISHVTEAKNHPKLLRFPPLARKLPPGPCPMLPCTFIRFTKLRFHGNSGNFSPPVCAIPCSKPFLSCSLASRSPPNAVAGPPSRYLFCAPLLLLPGYLPIHKLVPRNAWCWRPLGVH